MTKIKFKFMVATLLLLISAVFTFIYDDMLIPLEPYIYPLIFIYFLYDSLTVILPTLNKDIHSSKMYKKNYIPVENFNRVKLSNMIKKNNIRALVIFIIYTIGVLVVGFSFLYFQWFTVKYLYLVFFALNFSDYFCILVWCPFKELFLKNTCCNTCRISNWDRIMKVSILLFIPNLYTISINIIALCVFIYWEYNHLRYPERFYRISNKQLWCTDCSKLNCGKSLK